MGERKVMNKYFPPDFDHTKIPKQAKEQQQKLKERFVVRMMLPMSVRCMTCGEYMYKGKKFNSRKENVEGPEGDYLGIQIFRFYFKCTACSAEFTVKTDPKNMDYVVEGGAKANFELWKEEAKEKKELEAERTEGEAYDAMKKLENKTAESKRAMDILDALDEIRTQNARTASVGIDEVLESRQRSLEKSDAAAESIIDDEDGHEAAAAFAAARAKRLRDDEPPPPTSTTSSLGGRSGDGQRQAAGGGSGGASAAAGKAAVKRPKLPIGIVAVQKPAAAVSAVPPLPATELGEGGGSGGGGGCDAPVASGTAAADDGPRSDGGALLGLGSYGSSDDSAD